MSRETSNPFGVFMMIEAARNYGIIAKDLEYDLTWEQAASMYRKYEKTTYNNSNKPEMECIFDFAKWYMESKIDLRKGADVADPDFTAHKGEDYADIFDNVSNALWGDISEAIRCGLSEPTEVFDHIESMRDIANRITDEIVAAMKEDGRMYNVVLDPENHALKSVLLAKKLYRYTISPESMWSSFDFGVVEASNYEEARKMAEANLTNDFKKANEAFQHCDNTRGFSIEFSVGSIRLEETE